MDRRHRPHAIDLLRAGRFLLRVMRGHQADQPLAIDRVIHQADAARLPDGERDGRLRVNDQAAQRQNWQLARKIGRSPLLNDTGGRPAPILYAHIQLGHGRGLLALRRSDFFALLHRSGFLRSGVLRSACFGGALFRRAFPAASFGLGFAHASSLSAIWLLLPRASMGTWITVRSSSRRRGNSTMSMPSS